MSDHDTPEIMYQQAKLDANAIVETVFKALGQKFNANFLYCEGDEYT